MADGPVDEGSLPPPPTRRPGPLEVVGGLALLLVGLGSGLVGLLALVGFGLSGSSDVPRLVVVLAVFGGGGVAGVVGGVRMLGRPTRSTRRPRSI